MNNLFKIPTPAAAQAGVLKSDYGLENHGFSGTGLVYWNLPTEALVEEMLFRGEAKMSRHGPIVATTGKLTGRSASDKFVVREASTEDQIWWGQYNRPFNPESFSALHARLCGYLQGRDVFVPADFIIGGPKTAGQGWRMLVEQLSVGRCISLPSSATGGAKAAVFATGAYARIRRQFNTPVGRFEGVAEAIARLAGHTYIMDAARSVTAGAIDGGEKPSVPSAMLKYHCTEFGRVVANDAMDVHGGKVDVARYVKCHRDLTGAIVTAG